MPFLTKQPVTAQNMNGDTMVHPSGTVLSDWELTDFIRSKIASGEQWYRERFEPLSDREAHQMRVKATSEEGPRTIEGQSINAPFDDYIGLHPNEVIARMQGCSLEKVRQIKLYEQAGMNRSQIIAFVTPAEKEPWSGYDEASIGDILEKFSILSDAAVAEAKMYEANHRARPIIMEYDRATYEPTQEPEGAAPAQPASPFTPPAPVVPEPVPQPPQQPLSPAPPVASDGGAPDAGQLASQQQVAVPAPPTEPLTPMSAPPS